MNSITSSLLLASLLLVSTAALAENRAVNITLNDSNKTLDEAALKTIQKTVGTATTKGTVDTFLIYDADINLKNRFNACVEASVNTPQTQFDGFVNALYAIKTRASASYSVKPATHCNADNTLVCMANPLSCFTEEFIAKGGFNDYVARKQFGWGLAEISAGKILLDVRLGQDSTWQPDDATSIGLPVSTKNCSEITVIASPESAQISCTLIGNAEVAGKRVTLMRDINRIWTCDSDLDADGKLKYAPKSCRGL